MLLRHTTTAQMHYTSCTETRIFFSGEGRGGEEEEIRKRGAVDSKVVYPHLQLYLRASQHESPSPNSTSIRAEHHGPIRHFRHRSAPGFAIDKSLQHGSGPDWQTKRNISSGANGGIERCRTRRPPAGPMSTCLIYEYEGHVDEGCGARRSRRWAEERNLIMMAKSRWDRFGGQGCR